MKFFHTIGEQVLAHPKPDRRSVVLIIPILPEKYRLFLVFLQF